jgi:glycosyltransferase involved in cell wall biosynthesis
MPVNVLFIHQNFPGQYKHLAPTLVAKGHRVVAIGMHKNAPIEGVEFVQYKTKRGTTKDIHPWVIDYEAKVIRAEACAEACHNLDQKGFVPDVIFVHPGWGEALLLREVWPDTKQIHFVEFYYGPDGKDVGFDPEFPVPSFSGRCRLNIKNTNNLMNLYTMDVGVSPTEWQKSTAPERFQSLIHAIHDGVDTDKLQPNANAVLRAKDDRGRNIVFTKSDRVITFINRNFEPNRGYHSFMRALPEIMKHDPNLRVVLIGGDDVSYGARPDSGSWKEKYRAEVADKIDDNRVHFLGKVSYDVYCAAMQISSAHVYLTYPFVLSWSMLEAMAMGAPVIGSATSPVQEVIEDGVNGWLVDFFDYQQIADKVIEVLNSDTKEITDNGRKTIIDRYDLYKVCLPQQLALMEHVLSNDSNI